MNFVETELAGACVVKLEERKDARGFFSRAFCRREFVEHGLDPRIAQVNFASSKKKGTLRGLHFQYPPAAEAKFVRCTRGSVLDVIVDLRPESPTFLKHASLELTQVNRIALYVPERFAHGYQVLEDDTELMYHTSEFYTPAAEAGLGFNDPGLGINWPLEVSAISEKDLEYPRLKLIEFELRTRMDISAAT